MADKLSDSNIQIHHKLTSVRLDLVPNNMDRHQTNEC